MTDYESIHEWRFRVLQERIRGLNLPHKSRVLEVGCYPTLLLSWLRKNFSPVFGICSVHEPVQDPLVVEANIDKTGLPFAAHSFNLIVISEVIEHLLHGPERIIHECARVLAPGGKLVISTPNAHAFKHLLPTWLREGSRGSIGESIYHRHNRELTKAELEEVLQREVSFETFRVEYVSFFTPWRKRVTRQAAWLRLAKWMVYGLENFVPSFKDSLLAVVHQRVLEK